MAIAKAVENTAERYGALKMISDMDCFKEFLFREVTAYTEPSIGVSDPSLSDKNWWNELKHTPSFKPEYWSRYYDYLLKKPSWSITAVENINSSTDEIMNSLTNPRKGIAGERMGMVFGYVQSGKTAHYIGMINKAYTYAQLSAADLVQQLHCIIALVYEDTGLKSVSKEAFRECAKRLLKQSKIFTDKELDSMFA